MSAITWAVFLLAGISCTLALGTQTSIDQYPSIVQVEGNNGNYWLQQCAGAVLTNYHILSAATCFMDSNGRFHRIRAGTSQSGVGGAVATISHVYQHPTYGLIYDDANIAVVRLASSLPLGTYIQQALIMPEGVELPQGLQLNLVGWGTTVEGGTESNENLYRLDLLTVSLDRCLESYLVSQTPRNVTENMICAGLPNIGGRDYDIKDLGAPVFYQNIVAGVLAFGAANADDALPVVATSVASYSSWIIETAATG